MRFLLVALLAAISYAQTGCSDVIVAEENCQEGFTLKPGLTRIEASTGSINGKGEGKTYCSCKQCAEDCKSEKQCVSYTCDSRSFHCSLHRFLEASNPGPPSEHFCQRFSNFTLGLGSSCPTHYSVVRTMNGCEVAAKNLGLKFIGGYVDPLKLGQAGGKHTVACHQLESREEAAMQEGGLNSICQSLNVTKMIYRIGENNTCPDAFSQIESTSMCEIAAAAIGDVYYNIGLSLPDDQGFSGLSCYRVSENGQNSLALLEIREGIHQDPVCYRAQCSAKQCPKKTHIMKLDYPVVCDNSPCALDECCEPLGTCEPNACQALTTSSGVTYQSTALRKTPRRCNPGHCTVEDCCYEHGIEIISPTPIKNVYWIGQGTSCDHSAHNVTSLDWDICGEDKFECPDTIADDNCESGTAFKSLSLGPSLETPTIIEGCSYHYYVEYSCEVTCESLPCSEASELLHLPFQAEEPDGDECFFDYQTHGLATTISPISPKVCRTFSTERPTTSPTPSPTSEPTDNCDLADIYCQWSEDCFWNGLQCVSCTGSKDHLSCTRNGCVWIPLIQGAEEGICQGGCSKTPDVFWMGQNHLRTVIIDPDKESMIHDAHGNTASRRQCQFECLHDDACNTASIMEKECFLFGAYRDAGDVSLSSEGAMVFDCRPLPMTLPPSLLPSIPHILHPAFSPTYSPIVNTSCEDVYDWLSNDDLTCPHVDCTGELGSYRIDSERACCHCVHAPVGGFYHLNQNNIEDFLTDLKIQKDFTMAFWVKIGPGYSILWECAAVGKNPFPCAWVEDYQVYVQMSAPHFVSSPGGFRRALSNPELLKSNQLRSENYYSVQVAHDSVRERLSLRIDKDIQSEIPSQLQNEEESPPVVVHTNEGYMSDDVIFARHPFTDEEAEMVYNRYHSQWPKRFPECLIVPFSILGLFLLLYLIFWIIAAYNEREHKPDDQIIILVALGVLDFGTNVYLICRLHRFTHYFFYPVLFLMIIPPLCVLLRLLNWYLYDESLTTLPLSRYMKFIGNSFGILVLFSAIHPSIVLMCWSKLTQGAIFRMPRDTNSLHTFLNAIDLIILFESIPLIILQLVIIYKGYVNVIFSVIVSFVAATMFIFVYLAQRYSSFARPHYLTYRKKSRPRKHFAPTLSPILQGKSMKPDDMDRGVYRSPISDLSNVTSFTSTVLPNNERPMTSWTYPLSSGDEDYDADSETRSRFRDSVDETSDYLSTRLTTRRKESFIAVFGDYEGLFRHEMETSSEEEDEDSLSSATENLIASVQMDDLESMASIKEGILRRNKKREVPFGRFFTQLPPRRKGEDRIQYLRRAHRVLDTELDSLIKKKDAMSMKSYNMNYMRNPSISRQQLLLLLFSFFVMIGTTWFYFGESYSLIDSLYLVTLIFTTVGVKNDDFINDSEHEVFLIFYILFGVTILGLLLSSILVSILDGFKKWRLNHYLEKYDTYQLSTTKNLLHLKDWPYWEFVSLVFILIFGALIIGACEKWSPMQACYFAFVTGSTIGFAGDTLDSQEGKLIFIFWLPLVIMLSLNALSNLLGADLIKSFDNTIRSIAIFQMRRDYFLAKNYDAFNPMKGHYYGNHIPETEFVNRVLVKENKVTKKQLREIKYRFQKLDTRGKGRIPVSVARPWLNHKPTRRERTRRQPSMLSVSELLHSTNLSDAIQESLALCA